MGCFPVTSTGLPYDNGDVGAYNDNTMSYDECSQLCRNRDYFSIVYGRDCYCSDRIPSLLPTSQPPQCTFPNSGAPTQPGGSDSFQSLYRNDPGVIPAGSPGGTTTPQNTEGSSAGVYLGCFPAVTSDQFPTPLFKGLNTTDPLLTQKKCASFCTDYKFYGLQNGNQCWCTNSYAFGDTIPPLREYKCNVRAGGDGDEAAGGRDQLSAFENPRFPVRHSFLLCVQSCALQSWKFCPK